LSDDRFQPVVPNAIQIGDIVEVQMSILLAPTNNHRFKTTLKLRAIAILETKYTDVSTFKETELGFDYSQTPRMHQPVG